MKVSTLFKTNDSTGKHNNWTRLKETNCQVESLIHNHMVVNLVKFTAEYWTASGNTSTFLDANCLTDATSCMLTIETTYSSDTDCGLRFTGTTSQDGGLFWNTRCLIHCLHIHKNPVAFYEAVWSVFFSLKLYYKIECVSREKYVCIY